MIEKGNKRTINDGLIKHMSFNLWFSVGKKMGYFREYNIMRDENLKETKVLLEKAFNKTIKDSKWSEKDLQILK